MKTTCIIVDKKNKKAKIIFGIKKENCFSTKLLFWYKIHGWQIEDTTGTFKIKNIKCLRSNKFQDYRKDFKFCFITSSFYRIAQIESCNMECFGDMIINCEKNGNYIPMNQIFLYKIFISVTRSKPCF